MKKYDCKNCAKVYTSKTIENYFETQEWEFLIEDPVIELHGSGTLTRKMFCTNCKDVYITDEYGSSDMELEVEGPSPRGFGLDSDSDQSDQHNNDDVSVKLIDGHIDTDLLEGCKSLPEFVKKVRAKEAKMLYEENCSKSLLIIAKTRMNKGHCYIGFSVEDKKLYRPIYRNLPGTCCWPQDKSMELGAFYGFSNTFLDPDTSKPHHNNDLLVTEHIKSGESEPKDNLNKLYEYLLPLSKEKIPDLFGSNEIYNAYKTKAYVEEGVDCNSFGILKTKVKNVDFIVQDNKDKLRLQIEDDEEGRNNNLIMSWTSLEDVCAKKKLLEKSNQDDFCLVIIGLGRSFNPDNQWSKGRCYFLAIGAVTNVIISSAAGGKKGKRTNGMPLKGAKRKKTK